MLRIWFNRAYSTTMHTIQLLRTNPDGSAVHVVGTHSDPDSPVLTACDATEPEPDDHVRGDAYVDWALDVCRRHAIDVFVPRLHFDVVAAARSRFTSVGVALVAGPSEAARFLDDKAATYADAESTGLAVPPWRVVRSGSELVSAHDELSPLGTVCLKPVVGVGGGGWRPVPALLVMPFLPGPEVSVDCLGDHDGTLLAAVPRTKISRRRLLLDDPGAVDVARTIVARHRLSSLSDTQVRYWQQPGLDEAPRPYFLETNPRMSGGLHQTELAGVNLPWAAVLLAWDGPSSSLGRCWASPSPPSPPRSGSPGNVDPGREPGPGGTSRRHPVPGDDRTPTRKESSLHARRSDGRR